MGQQFGKILLYVTLTSALYVAGCTVISTESGIQFAIPMEEQHYRNIEMFEGIYTLLEHTDEKSTTTAIVFDFKNDAYIVLPANTDESESEDWKHIITGTHLQNSMDHICDTRYKVITIKPCMNCQRMAIGAIYSNIILHYTFEPEKMTISFKKPPAIPTEGG